MFITFEGGEGSGKTTQIKRLCSALSKRGQAVVSTREPGGSKLGEHIRDCLLSPDFGISFGPRAELMLFLASRAQHLEEVIKPALTQGKTVVCDRFNDSSIAYQGGARGLGIDTVERLCDLACDNITPDLTFFLDIDPMIGMSRLHRPKDRLENEKMEFHQKVRESFKKIASKHPQRIHVINAKQSISTVSAEIINIVDAFIHHD